MQEEVCYPSICIHIYICINVRSLLYVSYDVYGEK